MSEQHTNSQNKISGKFQNRIKKEQAENQKKEEEEQAKTGGKILALQENSKER
jgi:hypothetical protein